MPRGGARPNSGPKPKDPVANEARKAAEAQREIESIQAAQTAIPRARAAGKKTAVEIMEEMANAFYSLSAFYQPKRDASGRPVGDEEKFFKFGGKAADISGKLAGFQQPTYSSLRVTHVMPNLSTLTTEELEAYARLSDKTLRDAGGDTGGDRTALN